MKFFIKENAFENVVCKMSGLLFAESAEENDTPEGLVQRQQEAFAVHSQERIMGLLGAMVPPENKVSRSLDHGNYSALQN